MHQLLQELSQDDAEDRDVFTPWTSCVFANVDPKRNSYQAFLGVLGFLLISELLMYPLVT